MSYFLIANQSKAAPAATTKSASSAMSKGLRIGEPNDSFEQEADRAADEVVAGGSVKWDWSFSRMSVGAKLQRQCTCGGAGECNDCKEKEATLQRSDLGTGTPAVVPPIVHDVLRAPGRPLDAASRAFFEPRFGRDFSGVRVHSDGLAQASAAAVNANAYTVGTNIVLGKGISTSSTGGQHLLGHELTHVVQQGYAAQAPAELTISNDAASECQADLAGDRAAAGHPVGQLSAAPVLGVQREEAPQPLATELSWLEKGAIEAAAAPALAVGDTVHAMVLATLRGFAIEVKSQAAARAGELWDHIKDAFAHPTQIGEFILRYWWGLVKGIFSPITGLFDMAMLAGKLDLLASQILDTAWKRRDELLADASQIGKDLAGLGADARDAIANFLKNPVQTVKALGPWLSSLGDEAISKAEEGGHMAGNALMKQAGKPLPELGETAGEIEGTVLINIVLVVFTDGIGNAISQVATKLGEFASFLGKFGKAAAMAGKIVAELGELLGTVGGWISKAEAAMAKVAETVLKPIKPVLEKLGNVFKGLDAFLRKLLGISEEVSEGGGEELAGAAAKTLEGKAPAPHAAPAAPKSLPEPASPAKAVLQDPLAVEVAAPKTPTGPPTTSATEGPTVAAGGTGTGQPTPAPVSPESPAPLSPAQVKGIGPSYATYEEVDALIQGGKLREDAHVLGVLIKGPDGKIVGQWYEVSERGVGTATDKLLGHTEQKAMARIREMALEPGSSAEFVGSLQPCNLAAGCSNRMIAFAKEMGIDIRYRYVFGESGTTINDFTGAAGRVTKGMRESFRH
jgi:Domain of unknown function (DUF4157)